jgi:hypothetical protein
MCGRRKAVRRFTQLALAAGLVLIGGATSVKADADDAWKARFRQTVELERGRRKLHVELARERRKQRAGLRQERRDRRGGDQSERSKYLRERRKRNQLERERRFRSWREPDPPKAWRKPSD